MISQAIVLVVSLYIIADFIRDPILFAESDGEFAELENPGADPDSCNRCSCNRQISKDPLFETCSFLEYKSSLLVQ